MYANICRCLLSISGARAQAGRSVVEVVERRHDKGADKRSRKSGNTHLREKELERGEGGREGKVSQMVTG